MYAAVACLLLLAASAQRPSAGSSEVPKWLSDYEAAFASKDLVRLAAFYHADVTIYEGGGVNNGWVDYRDNHIGGELSEMESPKLTHSDVAVHLLDKEGRTAYVTSQYRLQARVHGRDVDAACLETLILVREGSDGWRIRHSHTSSRRRPSSPSPTSPSPGAPGR